MVLLNNMDKRYFVIIALVTICCVNLYIIADASDIVGSASINIKNYTFSVPEGFTLYDNAQNYVFISNPDNKMNVYVYTSWGKNELYLNKNLLQNNSKFQILSNGTISGNGIVIDSVYYQNLNNHRNFSTFFFSEYNHDFVIWIADFNYDNQKNETISIVSEIANSFRINYKY